MVLTGVNIVNRLLTGSNRSLAGVNRVKIGVKRFPTGVNMATTGVFTSTRNASDRVRDKNAVLIQTQASSGRSSRHSGRCCDKSRDPSGTLHQCPAAAPPHLSTPSRRASRSLHGRRSFVSVRFYHRDS